MSGCVRECAEAQCKDFGLIATETGYNLYVCGNGGANPRHGDLFASDLSEEESVLMIDRIFMYYIMTADKLNRTSVWMEKLEGGLEYLREVVIDDKLGICDELEERMQNLVDTYTCEWKEVVEDPEKRKLFRQFVNSEETESSIEFIDQRGQKRPADWPKDGVPLYQIKNVGGATSEELLTQHEKSQEETKKKPAGPRKEWVRVGLVSDFPKDGGSTVKYGKVQIAVYNFASRGEWYACQNMCPHKNAFVLSRGIIGSAGGEPKVACPLHKKPFSLKTGESITGEDFSIKVFPVKIDGDDVFLELPPESQLDALLSTELHCISSCDAKKAQDLMTIAK